MLPSVFDLFDLEAPPQQREEDAPPAGKPQVTVTQSQTTLKSLLVDKERPCHATFSRAAGAALLSEFRAEHARLPPTPLRLAMCLECSMPTAPVPEVARGGVAKSERPATQGAVLPPSMLAEKQAKAIARVETLRELYQKQHAKQEKSQPKAAGSHFVKKSAAVAANMLLTLLTASSITAASAERGLSRSSMLPAPSRLGMASRGGSTITQQRTPMVTTELPDIESLTMEAKKPAQQAEHSLLLTDILIAAKRYTAPGLPAVVKDSRKEELDRLMEGLNIEDFGFGETVGFCAGKGCVRCYNIYHDDDMDLSLFRLAPGTQIPMHSHPGMDISCRVLFGTARYRSCDLSDEVVLGPNGEQLRRMVNYADQQGDGPHTHIVTPDEGNVHEITAMSDNGMAFFDIITPSYSCKLPFFIPRDDVGDGVLEEVECSYFGSENFRKKMVDYRGPSVDLEKFKSASVELTPKEKLMVANRR